MWTQSNNNPIQRDINRPKDPVPYMNTLTQCINKMVLEGYTNSYKVTDRGLFSTSNEQYYRPDQVKVINFYRFEGQSDPADNAILYVIETDDGRKGTLIDAYGPYADAKVNAFMTEVEEIQKKVNKNDKPN